MARALFFTQTLDPHPDPLMRAMQYKPGMVITAIEDGREFGKFDVGPHSTVIEFPGVPAADLMDLCAPQSKTEIVTKGGIDVTVVNAIGVRKFRAADLAALKLVAKPSPDQVAAFKAAQFALEPAPVNPLIIE